MPLHTSTTALVRLVLASLFLAVLPLRADEVSPRFETDIQPLLAKHCLKCHGSGEAEAGFSLADRERALLSLESGHTGIVPHHPEQSELLIRVSSTEEGVRMPPEGLRLETHEIEILRRWIAAGADWPTHWAYRPLVPPALPVIQLPARDSAGNPIDLFILKKLQERNLLPAPVADRRTLLRRIYFDLIGMPPSPEDLERFLADESPLAYERIVDQLLSDPRYGERQARHWMDLVHYAETHGHDQDRIREHVWPYRDYLIRSFNADKPYARFIQEQVAGDVLFPGDPEALIATGFLAAGPWDESSLRDIREDSIDRIIGQYLDRDDIVSTVISTFASSTVHCARCHDHKFDPISQKDYYALQAVFATTDKANRPYDTDPAVAQRRLELNAELAALPERVKSVDPTLLAPELQQTVTAWEESTRNALAQWQPVEVAEITTANGTALKRMDDGSLLATGTGAETGKFPETETYSLVIHSAQPEIAAFQLDLLTHESLPQQGPGCQPQNGNLHLNEVRVQAIGEGDPRSLKIAQARADFNQDGGWSIEKSIDGIPETAWGIHPQIGKPHQAIFTLVEPLKNPQGTTLRIELEQSHGRGHLIGRFRLTTISPTGIASPQGEVLAPDLLAILNKPRTQRSDAEQAALTGGYLRPRLEKQLAELPPEQLVYCGTNRFNKDGSFRPALKIRPIHLLHRGDVNQPREEAQPGTLGMLAGLTGSLEIRETGDDAGRRAALAAWLSDHRNVLTWRSIANRLWQSHFGRGLVDTPNDFGKMGSPPTHPELLDWLTFELQNSEGSLKHLHRLIVTSAAYRQASQHNSENAAQDGENRLLWRMHRSRLDAESVRDAILLISDTLDPRMGGPSVRQFQLSPGAQVTPILDYLNFNPDDPANYRRSVYRFVYRTVPDPFMDALDCPDASQLTPARNSSFTPLQALALMNDRLIVRQSERFAEKLSSHSPEISDQVRELYRKVLLRAPNEQEQREMVAFVTQHGLANACRLLWNCNEFVFVE